MGWLRTWIAGISGRLSSQQARKLWLASLGAFVLALWFFRGSAREIRGQRVGTVRRDADVTVAVISPNAQLACVRDDTSASMVWCLSPLVPLEKSPKLFVDGTTVWAPDKPWLATGDGSERLRAYDFTLPTPRALWWESSGVAGVPGMVLSVDWSPAGDRLAVAAHTWIRILDGATGKIAYEWPAGVLDIDSPLVAWSPDSRRLAVAGTTGLVILDSVSGREIKRFRISEYGPKRLTWSPDSQLLAVREFDDRGFPAWINVYCAANGHRLQRFHCWDTPRLAEWSPDGKLLLIGAQLITSYPGSPVLAVMDARSGQYVARLGSSRLPWVCARWTPVTNTVTAVRQDGEVWRWKLPGSLGNTRSAAPAG